MIIDIQFSPAVDTWPVVRDGVLLAEACGFDTAWVFDHFAGSVLAGGTTMIECFTLLGALSAATTRIGLGRPENGPSPSWITAELLPWHGSCARTTCPP